MKEKLKDFWNNIDWGKTGVSAGAGLIGGLLFNRFVLGNKSWKSRIISGAIGTLLGGGGSAMYDYYNRTSDARKNRSKQQQQISDQDRKLYHNAEESGSKRSDARAIPTNVNKQTGEDKKLLDDRRRAKRLADNPTIAKVKELEMTTRPVNAAAAGYVLGGQADKLVQHVAGKRQPNLTIKSDKGVDIKVPVNYTRGTANQLVGRTSGRIDAAEWAKLTPAEQYRVKEAIENKGLDVKLTSSQHVDVPRSLTSVARERASLIPEANRLKEQMRTLRRSEAALRKAVIDKRELLEELRKVNKANIAADEAAFRAYADAAVGTPESMDKLHAAAQTRKRLHESFKRLQETGRSLNADTLALERARKTRVAAWRRIIADRRARGGLKLKAPSMIKRTGHTLTRHAGKILGPTVSAALTIPTAINSWEDYSRLREIARNRGWL